MAVVKTSGDIIVTERYAYHTLCNVLISVENVVVWLVGFVGWQNTELLSEYLGCLPSIRKIVIIFNIIKIVIIFIIIKNIIIIAKHTVPSDPNPQTNLTKKEPPLKCSSF